MMMMILAAGSCAEIFETLFSNITTTMMTDRRDDEEKEFSLADNESDKDLKFSKPATSFVDTSISFFRKGRNKREKQKHQQ